MNVPTLDDTKANLGPMAALLGRHGYQVKGKTVRCPAADHDDRHPSAGLYTATDGDERVKCWSCGFDEDVLGVAEALGERVDWARTVSVLPRPAPDPKVMDTVKILFERRAEFPFEWQAAKVLALLPGPAARLEVECNRSYLSKHGDIDLILATAYMIRGTALFRFVSSKVADDPATVERAVRRLIASVEA